MQTSTTEITLAGVPYPITLPLTLGEMIDVKLASLLPDAEDPVESTRIAYQRATETVAAVLKTEHPEIDAAAMGKMRITDQELFSAALVEVVRR